MSYQSKKLWDEILDNIDRKYANEAAELFGREPDSDEEEYGELVPIEGKKLPHTQSKKRFIGGIVGFAAAAAVLALSMGIAVRYKKDDIVQPNPNVSSVSEDGSTSEEITQKNSFEDFELPTDPSLYSEDYSIYDEHFCGRWKKTDGLSGYYYGVNTAIRNVGYAPADFSLFEDSANFSVNGSIGFYEDERGAYMAEFDYMSDEPDRVGYAYIVFAPADDPDTLYAFIYYPSDEKSAVNAPRAVYVRSGEYIEENVSALNYLGILRLCSEMGIDPALLFGEQRYDDKGLNLIRQETSTIPVSDGIIVNSRTEDSLSFAIKCATVGNNNSLFYNFTMTKENGVWSKPVFADYTVPYGFVDSIPENTGTIDYDVLEEFFFADWRKDNLVNDEAAETASDVISIMYSDCEHEEEQLDGFVSVLRDERGAFAFTEDGGVYFVPENHRQLMYRFLNGNPLKIVVYRTGSLAAAENRDLYGCLTEIGKDKLSDTLGSGFENTYNNFLEFNISTEINGDVFWIDENSRFLYVAELSGDRAALVHKYFEKGGYGETTLVSVFERTGGEWEYTETYYDIDYDFTALDKETSDITVAESLKIYEDMFFGEWYSGIEYYDKMVFNYSEEIYGARMPGEGSDGYYISVNSGGASIVYYIPCYDTDTMYYYGEGVASGACKRDYSCKYTRTSKQFDKELHEMMTLCGYGREKLFEMKGGNLNEVFNEVYTTDYVLDKDGVSWTPGLHGYLSLPSYAPVLVSMDENHVVLSQTYIKSQMFDDESYGGNTSFENGTLKTFILTFTGQDGVWSCDISDTGESVDTVISFNMDMSIFPHFIGVWRNDEASYTLDYYNDFCEANVSWISGFEETSSMWLMKVHRVAAGYDSPIIPDGLLDTLFVIEKDNPDVVKLYRDENAMPSGEPLKTFTRSKQLDTRLPDRGYISIYGLYALIDIADSSGGLEEVLEEYCFNGTVTGTDGETLYTDPSKISKPEYVILERSYDKIKLATTFYSENKSAAYDYVVTFRNTPDRGWYMFAYEPAIYGLYNVEKILIDNGYYAFNEESDGKHLYFFDSSDNIIYELDENVSETAVYTTNDNDLFLAELSDDGTWALETYINGMRAGVNNVGIIPARVDSISLDMVGGYLILSAASGTDRYGIVYDPYDTWLTPIMTSDFIEFDGDSFVIRQDGELITYNTVDGSLEGVLPLLKRRAHAAWSILNMGTDQLNPTMEGLTIEKDGMTYYHTNNPLFPSYSAFENFFNSAFTGELAAEMLDSCYAITNYDGRLYAIMGGRGGDISIAEVRESEPMFIDDSTAEIICEVYRWSDMDKEYSEWVMSEEPDEVYSLYLEKTDAGWRFSSFYMPY